MKKCAIAVLFGGCSAEYGVSLESAHAVLSHIDQEKYTPIPIGISREGDWFYYTGAFSKILEDVWCGSDDCVPAAVSPSRGTHGLLVVGPGGVETIRLDAAFPVLHGKNGEDGTVQGLFELAGIPVVGCGVLASALCMDKDRAHKLAQAAGVAVPASFVVKRGADVQQVLAQAEELGYPVFVKPVRAGSSYGITKVKGRTELLPALRLAFQYDERVILEECISGFETGCAILGNDELTVGELDEIELSGDFFDFAEKYTLKTSAIHVPARIPPDKAREVKEAAQKVYRALDCRGFARVDLFLEEGGRIVFNEVNTIPGFTAHSRYPSMMKASGLSFEQMLTRVIELAVEP